MAWLEGPNGQRYPLKGELVTIGRGSANDVNLPNDTKVSRTHAQLQLLDGQWVLLDLGSSNGTRVNRRGVEKHPLRSGDLIVLGATSLLFVADHDPHATEADEGMPAPVPDLSERERQVITLIAQGLTDREIGEQLFISASTVRSHLDRISEKTGLRRRAELTRLAMDLGLIG